VSKLNGARILVAAIACCCLMPASWGEEMLARPSDQDIKKLAKNIEREERNFERALDSQFKRSVLRGPGGEIDVDKYLEDLSVAIERLAKRFTGSYSASTEAAEVLKRASFMNGYIRDNPTLKGANEWDVFGASLQRLAAAYGTDFPLPDDAQVRRIGDGELVDASNAIAKFSRDFERVLGKSTQGIEELKEPVKKGGADLKSMAAVAKQLASRIRSGKPASAEARQLTAAREQVQVLVDEASMPDDVKTAWAAGESSFRKIDQAFGL